MLSMVYMARILCYDDNDIRHEAGGTDPYYHACDKDNKYW